MTLYDYISEEAYKGFDWDNGEVVIVDQRNAQQFICRRRVHNQGDAGVVYSLDTKGYTLQYSAKVWNWTHTKTQCLSLFKLSEGL